MAKKKSPNIFLVELFMAKCGVAGWDRCFYGTITRRTDETGNPVVCGKIKVNSGYIYAMASEQKKLGEMLDEMVLLILDKDLHSDAGVKTVIAETTFFFN